ADGNGCQYLHTGRNHTADTKDIGHVLQVRVLATNSRGTSTAIARTEPIRTAPPVNVSPPSIFGDPVVAEQLRALPGAWSSPYGARITINYYWSRCAAAGANCDYLHTGRTHDVQAVDEGHVLQVRLSVETAHGVRTMPLQTPVIRSVPPVNVS